MNNVLGWATTFTAFVLNIILEEEINKVLTIIISSLSGIYLAIKIVREYKAYNRDEIEYRKHQKRASDNNNRAGTDPVGDS